MYLDGAHASSPLLSPLAPKAPSPSVIPPALKPQAPSSFHLPRPSVPVGTSLPTPLATTGRGKATTGTKVPTTSYGPGDYGSRIGRRRVMNAYQRLQSTDNGSRTSDNRSRASDDESPTDDDGSRVGDNRSQARCIRLHLRASVCMCYPFLSVHRRSGFDTSVYISYPMSTNKFLKNRKIFFTCNYPPKEDRWTWIAIRLHPKQTSLPPYPPS